jgi:hypothetical protein
MVFPATTLGLAGVTVMAFNVGGGPGIRVSTHARSTVGKVPVLSVPT